jgi:hypothetical protein
MKPAAARILFLILVLLFLVACASEKPRDVQPPMDAWKSEIPYKPRTVRVEGPTVVALMPPILFGKTYPPPQAAILKAYETATAELPHDLPDPKPRILLTSADFVVIPGAPGKPGIRVERSALEGHYGYVLAEPGREPRILDGVVGQEKLVKETMGYFKLRYPRR